MNVHSCFYFQFRHWYPRVINASRSFLSELPLIALSVHTSTFLSELSLVVPSVVTRFHTNLIICEQTNGLYNLNSQLWFRVGATDVDEWIHIIVSVLVRPSYDCHCNRALIKPVTFGSVKTHQHVWLHVYQICKFVKFIRFVETMEWQKKCIY